MKRFMLLLIILFAGYVSKPLWEEPVQQLIPSSVEDAVRSAVDFGKDIGDHIELDAMKQQLNSLFSKSDDTTPTKSEDTTKAKAPKLTSPEDHFFSIHNMEIGDSRAEVEDVAGKPERTSENEYGVNWETYHHNYQNFFMVAYDEDNQVRGFYTNQDLISSSKGIKLGSSKESVRKQLGTPETGIRKGWVTYQNNSHGEYDIYRLDHSYITIFYDKHENNTVTAVQVIDENLEKNKRDMYTEPNRQLKEGLEYQLFDLTNASRVKHDLPVLSWDDHVRETARKHSADMAENHYFDHTNLQGQSPFDRMREDDIRFLSAGENLAYGQYSSIFAHEGLMNSMGHRKNILRREYRNLGVGVAFNNDAQPYYTENFYSNSLN